MSPPDAAFRSRFLLAFGWSLFAAFFMSGAIGYQYGPTWASIAFVGLVVVFTGLALLIAESGGWAAGRMAHPTGVPYRFDHSPAKAMLVRGEIDRAVDAFEEGALLHPDDPAPCFELARIHRDRRAQPDVALRWFRRARDRKDLTTGEARVVMREILELARKQLGDPMRAAPDLALHAERWAGSDEGAWAARELAEIKAEMGGRG